MNRTLLPAALALALAVAATGTAADAQRVSRITAGKLAGICGSPQGVQMCDAYIAGVADALAGAKHFEAAASNGSDAGATCIPSDVSTATLRSTVADYLRGHAESRGKPAAVPVVDALHAAYPCVSTP